MLCYNRVSATSSKLVDLFLKKPLRFISYVIVITALLLLASCGGGNDSSSSTPPTSKFPSRLFLLNSSGANLQGYVYIMNATNDQVWQSPIVVSNNTDVMVESPDKSKMLLFSSGNNGTFQIDNSTESTISGSSLFLPARTESMAILSDNKTAVAALRNLAVSGAADGAVLVLDMTAVSITATIPVPQAKTVVLNNASNKVLAFADNSDSVYLIDATAKTATPIAGFDRPVGAVFSTDDSKAYVLNCGPECGGTAASVQILNMSDNSLGAKIPVSAATVGLLSNNKLYVAGTAGNVGLLDVIDTGTSTVTQTGVTIANGYHTVMAMADGGKLYIGSQDCTISNGAGCLSIFNTSGTSAVIPTTRAPGPVTSVQPLTGRNLAYVTIGGELIIFDTPTDAPRSERQLDVVGNAFRIKLVD